MYVIESVHKQFYRKLIRLSNDHGEEVEKEGGVFYTPKQMVDLVTQKTLRKILKGKTLKKIPS